MKRIALLIGSFTLIHFGCAKSAGPTKPPPVASGQAATTSSGSGATTEAATQVTGLTADERKDFYHTPEGSALFPLDWLRVLRDKDTSRPFLENPERFGLLPDPQHPLKLPVGMAPEVPRGTSAFGQWVGVNCTACHVGELTYQGKSYRIDGGPNLFDLDHF